MSTASESETSAQSPQPGTIEMKLEVVSFGRGLVKAEPGSAERLEIVADIEAALRPPAPSIPRQA